MCLLQQPPRISTLLLDLLLILWEILDMPLLPGYSFSDDRIRRLAWAGLESFINNCNFIKVHVREIINTWLYF
jgi:hypothetical protein